MKPGQTPPQPISIGAMLTASVSILGLGEAELKVQVSVKDKDTGSLSPLSTFTLQTLDSDNEPIPPGLYLLSIKSAATGARAVTCTFNVKDADAFRFVATDHTAVVSKNRVPAKNAAEQLVESSSL